MSNELTLTNPWLVAVWPGMGHVAISAGYYLMAKLGMHLFAEFSARELFEVQGVDIKDGLVHTGRLPRSRLFVRVDPNHKRDLIVFIGEAQPPSGKYAFCARLIDYARQIGVERVFTFAALATQMHPRDDSRVYGVATDAQSLQELKDAQLEIMADGHIGGLNGVLLGVAADKGLRGTCLLGEMPHIFASFPFPKASLAVLRVFNRIAAIDLDFGELHAQAEQMEENLEDLLAKIHRALSEQVQSGEETSDALPVQEEGLSSEDEQHIEEMFRQAGLDRSKAYELKRELDRLGVFDEYEDRFLDLFQKPH